jgi:ABC-type glycerol-3-phosphate transport system substrate-binding protein
MKHSRFFGRISACFLLLAAAFLTAGCGGGGSSGSGSSAAPAGTGSVAILLTDAPSDEFAEINMRVVRAELLSDSGGHVTIFDG